MDNSQRAQEAAIYIAVRNGFGLMKRKREIHKVYASGFQELLCSSDSCVWTAAYEKLKLIYGFEKGKNALKAKEETDPSEQGKHPKDNSWY